MRCKIEQTDVGDTEEPGVLVHSRTWGWVHCGDGHHWHTTKGTRLVYENRRFRAEPVNGPVLAAIIVNTEVLEQQG
jgi:hypothetical protein